MSRESDFLRRKEAAPGEYDVKMVEMTRQNLEYFINLVDKAAAGSERIDSDWKEVLLW